MLYTNPVINEAVVVASPDEYWGETPCAFVSLRSKKNSNSEIVATEKEIIEVCRARLQYYIVSKTVVVKDELVSL